MGAAMRYQPQGRVRLSALRTGFAGATVFSAGANIVTGARLPLSSQTLMPAGIGATVALASGAAATLGIPVATSWSLLMVVRRDAQVQYPYFLGQSAAANPIALTGQHANIGNRVGWFDGTTLQDSGFSQPLGSTDVIGLTFDGTANRYSWYKNGKAYNAVIGANTGGGTWQLAAAAGEPVTNTFPLLAIAPRAASVADMLALTAQPWQLFDFGSSSSAYQAAVASAGASSGGGAATNTAVSPASASLSLIGYAPSVVRGVTVGATPAAGSLTIAGYAPTVTQGATTSVVPGVGSFSIAGYAPSITQSINTSIAPGSAGLALTGYPPTVARTANQSQTPQPGALTITGYAPTVVRLAAQSIQLPVSSMAVRGYAPSVVQSAPVIAVSVRFNILPRNFNLKTTHFSN